MRRVNKKHEEVNGRMESTDMNTPELRRRCAEQLGATAASVPGLKAFAGLDGFVDEILHVVDKRESAEVFQRMPTIGKLAERLAGAAGKSTNIEMVNHLVKLGGNGPIMANALASFGLQVTYVGGLGYPQTHAVFQEFTQRAEVHSIAEPGITYALEFEDGKVMLGKHSALKDVNWANLQARFGQDRLQAKLAGSDLTCFVNWTMLPYMSDIWEALQKEICPSLGGRRGLLFVDLADPEKRLPQDIARALELIVKFQAHFNVILGLNEKEAVEVSKVLQLTPKSRDPQGFADLARQLIQRLPVSTVVIHPVTYALATSGSEAPIVEGPYTPNPLITTGAGDHFNAGFCLGKLLGLEDSLSLLVGVATSGFYVRTARSPSVTDLIGMLQNWPQ
jgi:hypothetical protein